MLRFIRNGPLARAISNDSSAGIASCFARAFSASAPVAAKPLPPRPKLNEDEIEVSYIKGSGPGGQKIVWWSLLLFFAFVIVVFIFCSLSLCLLQSFFFGFLFYDTHLL